MAAWSEKAWEAGTEIFEQIKTLPFLHELANGTLPNHKFRYYISQDSKYLDSYTRVLAHIASRLPLMDDVATFLDFARDGVAVEKSLHAHFNPDKSIPMSDACLQYTSLLKAQTYEAVAVEAAAILPCFWVYQKVGEYLLSIADLKDNPYSQWIETYSDPSFDVSTRKAIDVCDRLAANVNADTRNKMTEVYIYATQMERIFWQSAYDID